MAGRNDLGERFKCTGMIGEGSYGEVSRCYDTQLNSEVAVKRIPFESAHGGLPSVILREISILKELDHPNVVRLLDVIVDSKGVSLVLECLSCDLSHFIRNGPKPLLPHLIKNLLFQILQGVSYYHSQKILHRDMKPGNLLLDNRTKTIKIADFGHGRTFEADPSQYSVDVTTLQYRAPELLLSTQQTTTAVDIWAVGCIFAEMVTGRPLFASNTERDVLKKIIKLFGVPSEEEWEGVTAVCLGVLNKLTIPPYRIKLADQVKNLDTNGLDLISKMLCFLPSQRITAFDALNHPYFEDSLVAMKWVNSQIYERNGLSSQKLRDISMLKELDHPRVAGLLDVIVEPNKDVKLVMESLESDLCKFIKQVPKPMSLHLIKNLLFQILQGVSYCHSQKVLHVDLKPENLLMDLETTTLKLTDFGHSRTFEAAPSECSFEVGTAHYRAPELLLRMHLTTTATAAVDIWAVGCIFAEMVKGEPLFDERTEHDVLRKIIWMLGVPSEEEWKGVTAACLKMLNVQKFSPHRIKLANIVKRLDPDGLDLISKMLCFLPSQRINALDALNHPYFEDHQ